TTTIYPYSSWNVPYIHSVFANAPATISGVETSYKALKKKGKIKNDIKFLVIAGDGGAFDIGLQSLSGALERGHNFVFLCYSNEGYQNTGAQRSSATEKGTATTTTPLGINSYGKSEFKKDLTKIAIAHNIPYIAQVNPHDQIDLFNKAKKAFETNGPAVLIAYAACPTNMKAPSNKTIEISKLATECCFWPLYEVINGKYLINYKPEKKIKVEEYLKTQTKFLHLLKPENKKILKEIQDNIDKNWKELLENEEKN
ncbi:MAG: thiamine pyrophosphate-dependent enzyme, partial [archaeon]